MKTKVLGGLFAFLLGILVWNGDSMTVNAEEYTYQDKQVETAEGFQTVKQWYKGPWDDLQEIEGMPELQGYDRIHIYTQPEGDTKTWLEGLNGDLGGCEFQITLRDGFREDLSAQIGTPENPVSNCTVDALGCTTTVYGNLNYASICFDGYVPAVELNVYGDIQNNLSLGWKDSRWDYLPKYSLYVDGNITGTVEWNKTIEANGEDYKGFNGNMTVTGTVAGGTIKEVTRDDVLGTSVWYDSGVIGSCAAGTFKIVDGVLSDAVPVEKKEPVLGEYDFNYFVTTGYAPETASGRKTIWQRYAYHKEDGSFASVQECEQADVPAGSIISIVGLAEPVTLDMDIAALNISNSGQHCPKSDVINLTVNGDVGNLTLDIHRFNPITVNLNGTVENATVNYRYNSDANVNVSGKINHALHKAIFPTGTITVGRFSMENMPMIVNGIWNPLLLFYALQEEGAIAYAPMDQTTVTTALADDELEKEITITTGEGEKTLVKEATVLVEQTASDVIAQAAQKEEMTVALEQLENGLAGDDKEVVSMEPVCGVDISVGTQYVDMSNGSSYTGDDNYAAEEITQLQEGNSLPFTVKIPEGTYDESKEYKVIREHRNGDGSVKMDVLETTRDGDRISFRSDKFSTFVVVAAEVEEKQAEPGPEPEPKPEPEPEPEPKPTPTPAPAPEPAPEPTPAPAPVVNTNPYQAPATVIRTGSIQREAVRWLQTELKAAGYQLEVDGVFGKGTRAALMDYQLRHGLAVDGICGKMTINALSNDGNVVQTPATSGKDTNTYPVPTGIIKAGHGNGAEVRWIQTRLVQAGYRIAVDGLFGPGTRAALMDYQLRHGLAIDGVCGPKTIQSMQAQ